jgi:predicted RNA-binding protein with PIN domain
LTVSQDNPMVGAMPDGSALSADLEHPTGADLRSDALPRLEADREPGAEGAHGHQEVEESRGPAAVNGFGVPDWLVEPLFDAALRGLESMARTEVPPRLIPLAGRRHRKLSPANRETIMASLGRHDKFTGAVFDRLFEALPGEAEALGDLGPEEIIQLLEEGEAEVPETVSLLFVAGRPDDARVVARWAVQQLDGSDTLTGMIDALSRQNLEAQERLRRLDQELAHERRARRSLERRIDTASSAAEAARAQAMKAESLAGWNRVERNAEQARAEDLQRQLADLEAAVESGRRERRDLLTEQQDLQGRYQRARRELRELREKLPLEEVPRLELRSSESPPTTADLRDRFVQFGSRGVLESKHLMLIVDGWNVGLAHAAGERLEDKRRVLEQGLERYKSRTGNQVMVAYDGRKVSWFWTPRAGGRSIARVFTEGETADDFIVAELEAGFGADVTPVVVTSDRELRRRCIAQGAFVISSEDLAKELRL